MAKYQAYPEYIATGVDWLGVAPKDWNVIPVGRLFWRTKRTNFVEKELLSVYRDFGVIPTSSRDDNNNKPSEDLTPYQLVEPADLVMNKMKAWQGSIAISEFEGIVSPAYFVYQPNKKMFQVAESKYIHYLLRHPMYIAQYMRQSKGIRVNQWDLDPEEFQRIELLLPSKAEQIKIINFLDHETAKIDTLIEKQQQLIQLLKEKRQAVISHAVTKGLNPDAPMKDSGVESLGKVPEHWDIGKIKNLSHVISKGTTPSTMGAEFETSGIRFLKAENIGKGFHATTQPEFYISKQTDEQLARSRLRDRDVLVIIAGATTGQASLITEELLPANTNQAVSFIRPINPEYSEYIVYWLSTEYAQSNIWQNAVQAAQPNLSMETLGNIYIPIPPKQEVVPLVFEIQKKLLKLSHVIENAEKAIQFMQERRTALISAAVTGKIDVRNWQVNAMQSMESN